MLHLRQIEAVRELVAARLAGCGADDAQPVEETILIRNGQYCGRRFQRDGLTAVWFIEEREVKIYGRDGAVAAVCSPPAIEAAPLEQRRIA